VKKNKSNALIHSTSAVVHCLAVHGLIDRMLTR